MLVNRQAAERSERPVRPRNEVACSSSIPRPIEGACAGETLCVGCRSIGWNGGTFVERSELESRIAELGPWHYQFEFDDGVITPPSDPGKLNRHEQRRRYFFDALLKVTGGTLAGKRVLDLGCNAGFWASNAMAAGADFLLGVDARERQLEQARMVFEAKHIEPGRYRFEQGNIFEHSFDERFDIVMCLGLMYHISKPTELFELMAGVGAEILVIDTIISPLNSSVFSVQRESVEGWLLAADYETVLIPSRQAVVDLAGQFGYETVPLKLNMTDFTGLGEYYSEQRLAFICAKGVSLEMLESEPVHPLPPLIPPRYVRKARRKLKQLRG
jgi:SAM-dependent methyltransferase